MWRSSTRWAYGGHTDNRHVRYIVVVVTALSLREKIGDDLEIYNVNLVYAQSTRSNEPGPMAGRPKLGLG